MEENIELLYNYRRERGEVMRFIHVWSYACADFLMNQLKESHEKRRVYYYGFQIIIGAVVKGFLLIISSLLLGTLLPTVFLVLIFGSLRMLAGGYHMDTYGKCIFTSLGMFVFLGAVARYTYIYWNPAYLIILVSVSFLFGLYGSIMWAPADTPNKPITKPEEIKKFKTLSVVYSMVWYIATGAAIYFRVKSKLPVYLDMYIISGSFGVLLEIFTITPAGYKFFDIISGKLSKPKTN